MKIIKATNPLWKKLKDKISPTNPLRLLYHKLKAILAALIYFFPSRHMICIGITGTNGKTTTANLVSLILDEEQRKNCLISTTQFKINGQVEENNTKMTFPDPFRINSFLSRARRASCKFAIVEVTSHAISQSRIWGIDFDVVVFTNLSHDHLDYHRDFDDYRRTKGRIFGNLEGKEGKTAILNSRDSEFDFFNSFSVEERIGFGGEGDDLRAENIKLGDRSSDFNLVFGKQKVVVHLPMPGEFNIENALAASGVAIKLGVDLELIATALKKSDQSNPGRMEFLPLSEDFDCLVDFAHTPDALEKILEIFPREKIILVFGCTGNRDKSKRKIMGQIADSLASRIVLTSDDPYDEDPISIIEQVKLGIRRSEGDNFWIEIDRKKAIKLALSKAKSADKVIIAGKGAEKFQVVKGKKIPHCDGDVVMETVGV